MFSIYIYFITDGVPLLFFYDIKYLAWQTGSLVIISQIRTFGLRDREVLLDQDRSVWASVLDLCPRHNTHSLREVNHYHPSRTRRVPPLHLHALNIATTLSNRDVKTLIEIHVPGSNKAATQPNKSTPPHTPWLRSIPSLHIVHISSA